VLVTTATDTKTVTAQDIRAVVLLLTTLAEAVRAKQRREGLAQRAAARGMGIPLTTYSRLVKGGHPTLETVAKALLWVSTDFPDGAG